MNLASDALIDQHVRSCPRHDGSACLGGAPHNAGRTLSERDVACLPLAGDGQISEEIAERLGLSVHTVNAYLGSATIKWMR